MYWELYQFLVSTRLSLYTTNSPHVLSNVSTSAQYSTLYTTSSPLAKGTARIPGWVLLYVHRNRRIIRDGSPGRPLRLSHSSWALASSYSRRSLSTADSSPAQGIIILCKLRCLKVIDQTCQLNIRLFCACVKRMFSALHVLYFANDARRALLCRQRP